LELVSRGKTILQSTTYSVGAVLVPLEMYHAIETCKRCAATLVAMRVEFLLGEDVSAGLDNGQHRSSIARRVGGVSWRVDRKGKQTSQEKDTMMKFSLRLICGLFVVCWIRREIWDDCVEELV